MPLICLVMDHKVELYGTEGESGDCQFPLPLITQGFKPGDKSKLEFVHQVFIEYLIQ